MRKYTTVKKNISMYNRHRVVDRDPSNPDFQTISSMYQVLRDACWLKLISSGNVLYCDVFMDGRYKINSFLIPSTTRNDRRSA